MSAVFKEILLRVFVSGILCSVALILVGNGPNKEPVRLCCVALTLIVLMRPYSHTVPDIAAVLDSGRSVSESVQNEIEKADAQTCNAAIKGVEEYLGKLMKAEGIDGKITLGYKLEDGILLINSATVSGISDTKGREYALKLLSDQCMLSADSVFFEEGIP